MTKTLPSHKISAREAAYLALLSALKGEQFIADSLEQWREKTSPSSSDFHLAQNIAMGSAQRALTLDYYAQQLADTKKLSLKLKEKALLRTALYQFYFLERIPSYAIANESVALAKKYCHRIFANYLNAILRKIPEQTIPQLPQGNSVASLSVRYSYPPYFISELMVDYKPDEVHHILESGNIAAPITIRVRKQLSAAETPEFLEWLEPKSLSVCKLNNTALLPQVAASADYYIQNITPVALISGLITQKSIASPQKILDLCSAPGGKLIALHDYIPTAALYANDLTPDKTRLIQENCVKYGIKAEISCASGEAFPIDQKFDIVVLDVPCSNTGVLNKRPEARWRLSKEAVLELEQTQLKLIAHAKELLSPGGEIWFMTCSILKSENEKLVEKAANLFKLTICHQQTILPNLQGWDGGFACVLKHNS